MNSTKLNFKDFALLAVSTLTVLASATIAPSLPYIAQSLSNSEHAQFWAQLGLCIPGIVVALSAAWIGKITANKNSYSGLMIALASYGVLGCAYLLAPTQILVLLLSRGALGFCVAAIMILTTVSLIKGKSAALGQQLLGYQAAAGGFGGVLYMFLANQLTLWFGLAPFGLYAIAWVFALLLWQSQRRATKDAPEKDLPESRTQDHQVSRGFVPGFFLFATLAAIEMLALYALVLQIPLLTTTTPYHLSSGLTLAVLCMSITAAYYGFFQRYMQIETQHMLGMMIVAIGFAILGLAGETIKLITLVISLCIVGLGLGLLRPNLIAWLFSTVSPSLRQPAMGKLTAVFFLAQFFAPMFVYPITEKLGLSAMWLILASATLGAAAVIFVARFKTYVNANE